MTDEQALRRHRSLVLLASRQAEISDVLGISMELFRRCIRGVAVGARADSWINPGG
ncbi:hypothetical protein SynA1825c_01330 [Synechococcus sp. A18-25c]|uniref:hypothetical protein n=1 Tax=Synechococcus sp. A18-25c TaxID=1866938 RepID=UPI001647D179|nr:hypothetical protein [Synechococcus sp. A18-25c]QNJ19636.1 hypothetical protein SynA1825c_01330 [Synechococcus sp. A18-25c]